MQVVYLDQNKWIELARAVKTPAAYPELVALVEAVTDKVRAGGFVIPLSASNLYETYKINDPQRRHDLASLQASLSGGLVFRGRYKRLENEISRMLRDAAGLQPIPDEPNWFLSSIFFEAFAEWNDPRLGCSFSEDTLKTIRNNPAYALYQYLATAPDEERTSSVIRFSGGSDELRLRIEDRRSRQQNEPLSMRRKIYGALLLIDEADLILQIARNAGLPWTTIAEMGGPTARRIVRDVPTYYIERELVLRLEMQNRPIAENDFRDMQSFCTVVSYADLVIGENQFTNLCEQARLPERYGTRITKNIFDVKEFLSIV